MGDVRINDRGGVIHIAICLNDNFVMPVTVLIQSIGENKGSEEIAFHAISLKELSDSSIGILNEQASKFGMTVEYHIFGVPEDICTSVSNMRWWSPEVFLKLFIPEILPDLSKVLVMDGDMIVRHSLVDLWNEDVNGYALAGVPDCASVMYDSETFRDMHYDIEYGYLNAGMLLMNLDYHRVHNLQGKYIEWLKINTGKLAFLEQTVINNVIYNQKRILPLKYNLHYTSYMRKYAGNNLFDKSEIAQASHNPTIVHYIWKVKPWHKLCRHPYLNEWDHYLSQTSFKGYRKRYNRKGVSLPREIILFILWRVCCISFIFKCKWI